MEEFIGLIVNALRKHNTEYDLAVFANDHIGSDVITYGRYDRYNLEKTPQVLNQLTGGDTYREGICLDIGANIGNHSLYYGQIFKQVIAFEPNPIANKLLQASVLKNRITNIRVCTTGLGLIRETKKLSIFSDNLGKSSLVQQETRGVTDFNIEIEIDIGDNLLQSFDIDNLPISFIKIDVEGFEDSALLGLQKTIIKHRPVICIELNFLTDTQSTTAAFDTLKKLGYENFYVLDSGHSYSVRGINILSKLLFDSEPHLVALKDESKNYPQVFCTINPVNLA